MAVTTVSRPSIQSSIATEPTKLAERWYRELTWVLGAALVGFSVPTTFVSFLHWPRAWFVLPYALAVLAFVALYVRWARIDVLARVRQHWLLGLAGGVVAAVFVVTNVLAQPVSPAPVGLELTAALVRLGVVYAIVDALLLSVLPLFATWRALSSVGWTHAWPGRIATGVLAIVASLTVAGAYHLGFPEYRGAGLLAPLIGNGVLSLASLLTMSPVAAVLGHIAMHVSAVLHGINTAVQLPPHY